MFRSAVYGVCEEQMAYREDASFLCEFLIPFIRFWGVFTSVVMCGVGVDIAVHNHGIGYFYVLCSGIVFFLEVAWIITLFIQICSRNEFGPCMNCWTNVLWLRLWRKSVLYSIFASILFLRPHRLWLSIVAGLQLLVLAGLYLLLTYRANQQSKVIPSPRLLNNSNSPSQEDNFDKHNFLNPRTEYLSSKRPITLPMKYDSDDEYDDITDVLDDGLPAPLLNDNLSELDQDTILEM
uniref:Transmembrane protein 72 n=2 Tax=Lygus hesperus TaxID=30085 RepID=A0A0A9XD15_LYGHE